MSVYTIILSKPMIKPNPNEAHPIPICNEYLAFCKIDENISQIHNQLLALGHTFSHQLSEDDDELLAIFPQYSIMRSVLHKSMEVRDRFNKFVLEENQIIASTLALLKQIQSYLLPVNYYHKKQFHHKLVQNYHNLKLPVAQLKLGTETGEKRNKTRQNSQNSSGLQEEVENLRKQKLELELKIRRYEQGAQLIEDKLMQLFEHSKVEEKRINQKGKLVDRICQNVYSQHFMIQANFDIRNEFYFLKQQNEKIKAEISKSKEIILTMKRNYDAQKKYLKGVIDKLQSENICRNQAQLAKSFKELQQKMRDLQIQRLKDQKMIKGLQLKVQNLSLAKPSTHFTKHFPPSVQNGLVLGQDPLKAYTYNHHQKQHKQIKSQNQIKYSKSTCVLIQPFETPKSSHICPNEYRKFCSEVAFQERKIRPESQQDLKTSGFFLQPEEYSYFSNQTCKRKQQRSTKRTKECKTPSNLS